MMVWMEISQKNMLFKKTTIPKIDFGCESYALLKKDINGNQISTWQVEVVPHGDTHPSNNVTFKNKFFMK
jgi:hypothetical protein